MNQKIPFHELSARIALATGIGAESAELFVKNFFDLLSEALTSGENVRIKGLGAFNVIESNGERNIEFIPDKEITDVINAPFAIFEAVSLNDDLSDEMLVEVDKESQSDTDVEVELPSNPEPMDATKEEVSREERPTTPPTPVIQDRDTVIGQPEPTGETTQASDVEIQQSAQPEQMSNPVQVAESTQDPKIESPTREPVVEVPVHKPVTTEIEAQESVEKAEEVIPPSAPPAALDTNTPTTLETAAAEDSQKSENETQVNPTVEKTMESTLTPPIPPVSAIAEQTVTPPPPATIAVPETNIASKVVETPSVPPTTITPTVMPTVRPVAEIEEDEEEYVTHPPQQKNNGGNFWIGLIVGLVVGLALGACGVYLAIDKIFPTMHQSSVFNEEDPTEADALFDAIMSDSISATAETMPTDTTTNEAPVNNPAVQTETLEAQQAEAAPAAVSSTPVTVTDTIRRGYLIHDMAKKHFGSKDFWVYIYEENKSKIGNPNTMQAGVVLVIPSADKYGISANDPESLRRARNKAAEVLRKYSK